MNKKLTRLLSWLVVLALVLPMVPAFTLPASAAKTDTKAQVVYGSTNLDAIADANEKALVQARISLLEQMIADPATALQQLENYCPVCNQVVTWEDWTGAVAVSGGNQKHLRVLSDRTIDASWPLEFYGDAASAHVLLAGDVQLKGPILCNTGCTNTDITIFGTGSITSGRLFRPLGSAKLTLIGGTYIPTSATYSSIDGGSLTAGSQINIYPYTVIGPANKDLVIANITAQQATINMYGGEIRNGQQTSAELGGNIGLKTSATLNMYGGTVSNGSNSATKGGNIASYSSNATINIYGGTVSGGSGKIGANLYGFGKTNIGGTALITGATATGDGGNIYQTGGQTLSISGGKIEGGSAAYGGNIYVQGTAKLNMTGGTISAGTATTAGGNLFADAGTTITVKNATITGGSAKNGGNISTSAAFTIENTTISDGTATGFGGNIYRAGGALATITGSEIKGGKAAYGANVHLHEDGSGVGSAMVMNNTTVGATRESEGVFNIGVYWGSKLAMIGGSINSEGVAARLAGDTNDPSQMVLAGTAAVSGNIFVDGKSTLAVDKGWTGSAEVTPAKTFAVGAPLMNSDTLPAAIVGTLNADNTFTAGGELNAAAVLTSGEYEVVTADATAGTLMLQEPAPEIPEWVKINDSVHMKPADGTIEEHTADCTQCGELPENFCPVCNAEVAWTDLVTGTANLKTSGANHYHVRVQGDQTITNNWPFDIYGDGGKIHVLLAGNLNLTGPIFFNGTSNNYDLTIFGSGNVHSTSRLFHLKNDNKITLIGGTYTQDSVNYALIDALNATTNGQINIYGGTVLGNAERKEETRSDVIELKNGILNMYGGTIRNGYYASGGGFSGGNVQLLENATFNMYGGTITGGKSTGDGGNVYVSGGSTMNMSGGTVTGGTAGWGGNIYVTGTSTLKVTGGVISKGSVPVNRGGNLFTDAGATVSIQDATITGGQAGKGGNISTAAAITITNSAISDGVASSGGNLFFNGGAGKVVQIVSSTITGGEAEVGANMQITDQSTAIVRDSIISTPQDSENASVCVYWGSTMVMIGGSIDSHQKAVNLIGNETDGASRLVLAGNASVTGKTYGIYVDSASTLAVDKDWNGDAAVAFYKGFEVGEELMNTETVPAAIVGTLNADNTFTAGGELQGKLICTSEGGNTIVTSNATLGTLKLKEINAVAVIGKTEYVTLNAALSAAKEGHTIILMQDTEIEEMYIRMGRVLDLNGNSLTVTGEVAAANSTANIIDSTNGTGLLVVDRDSISFNFKNEQLPVWIQGEGFRFVDHTFETRVRTAETHPDKDIGENAVQFRFWLDGAADCLLAQQLANGGADNGIQIKIKLTWTNNAGYGCVQYFTFTEELIQQYATYTDAENNWATNVFQLTVNGAKDITNLAFQPIVMLVDTERTAVVQSAAQTHVIQGELEQFTLKAGYKRVDVTPEFSVALGGYDSGSSRMSTEIRDRIYVTCIAFQEDDETVLLYTIDNCAIGASEASVLREMVTKATGVPGTKQIYGATHTHSAPSLSESLTNGAQYMELFRNAIVAAAVGALEDLAPAEPYATSTNISGMNFARQYALKTGKYTDTRPTYSIWDYSKFNYYNKYTDAHYAAEADANMVLLKFDREGDNKDILMVNWGAHPDHSSSLNGSNGGDTFTMISADYPGALREKLMTDTGMHVAFFSGAGGNTITESAFDDDKHGLSMQAYGEKLADYAKTALSTLKPIEGSGVESKYVRYDAAVDHSRDSKLAQAQEVYAKYQETYDVSQTKDLANSYGMQSAYEARAIITNASLGKTYAMDTYAVRVGGIGFISGGYEMFSGEGIFIKEESPYDATFLITGNNGYIPSQYAYSNFYYSSDLTNTGSYEAVTGRYAKGTAEALAEHFVSMLKAIQ